MITGVDGKCNLDKLYELPIVIITSAEDGGFLNDTTKIDEFTQMNAKNLWLFRFFTAFRMTLMHEIRG